MTGINKSIAKSLEDIIKSNLENQILMTIEYKAYFTFEI
jgi:hypothetical protein